MSQTDPDGELAELRRQARQAVEGGEATDAREALRALWRRDPTSATASFVLRQLARVQSELPPAIPCRIALLRSFTVEPAVPLLQAESALAGIDARVEVGAFNAWVRELMEPTSGPHQGAPDVAIVAITTRDVAPELWDRFGMPDAAEIERRSVALLDMLEGAIARFREASSAHVILHTLERPERPRGGILDAQLAESQVAAVDRLNAEIARLARRHHNVYVLDAGGVVARVGAARAYDPLKWHAMRLPYRPEALLAFACEWLRFLAPLVGRVAKCVVVDLDNTLWGGVVGEDGPTGIALGVEYPGAAYQDLQRVLLDLRDRGILLAIASKNNPDDAREILERHPEMLLRPSHFAASRIGWQPKALSLRQIAEELGIGVDALAFVDDNPVERAAIARELPQVTVVELPEDPGHLARTVAEHATLQRLSLSAEDRARGDYYAADRLRGELRAATGNLESFWRSLQMRVDWQPAGPDNLARIAQLTQKTNQFNLTTRRRSEQELAALLETAGWRLRAGRLRDRFGDSGLVVVAITETRGDLCEIDTLLMSCRVIGRSVETAALALLAEEARGAGARRLAGWFRPTAKNNPARSFYADHGFRRERCDADASYWMLELTDHAPRVPSWFSIGPAQGEQT